MHALAEDKKNPHYHFWLSLLYKHFSYNESEGKKHDRNSRNLLWRAEIEDAVSYIQQAVILMKVGRYDACKYVMKRALRIDGEKKPLLQKLAKQLKKFAALHPYPEKNGKEAQRLEIDRQNQKTFSRSRRNIDTESSSKDVKSHSSRHMKMKSHQMQQSLAVALMAEGN